MNISQPSYEKPPRTDWISGILPEASYEAPEHPLKKKHLNKDETLRKETNYDNLLDNWHDKVIEKADKYYKEAEKYELGSIDYYRYKNYAEGLYMALAMLSNEERKEKRRIKK